MRSSSQGRALLSASAVAFTLVLLGVAVVEAKVLHGTPHADRLIGSNRSDRLYGGPGPDVLVGRGSADRLLGGRGADKLRGGRAYDVLLGGRGRDVIQARDGHRDRIDCGPGRDIAFVNRVEDGVRDCERVVEP